MNDAIRQMQAELDQKQAQADELVRKENATGAELVQAEKLFDECDTLVKSLADARQDDGRRQKLQARGVALKSARTEPAGGGGALPFGAKGGDGGPGGFKVAGWEDGGHVKFDQETRRIVEEVGPGCFGEKTWQLMSSVEYKRDFNLYLRKGQRAVDLCAKTLQEGIDSQGGVFVPADLILRIIGRLPAPTKLRGMVQTIPTGRDLLTMPRKQYAADDKYTTAFRATWTGEIPSADPDVDDTNLLGEVEIPVHTAMLSAPVSKNNIEDSAFPLQSWLEGELNQVIDLLYEDMILNGSGVAQPFGIYSNIGASDRPEVVLSGSAGALAYDGLVDLQTAVPPQYDGAATFVMNKKSAYRAIAKLKDGSSRPLFSRGTLDAGLVEARAMMLLGDPVAFSLFAQDVGASNYPIAYGDWKGYYLAQRIAFSLQVLYETKAKRNQVELVGRVRFGGKPVEHWRLKIQKSNNS